jgi:hypothetical protein
MEAEPPDVHSQSEAGNESKTPLKSWRPSPVGDAARRRFGGSLFKI